MPFIYYGNMSMKYYDLNSEEEELLRSFEAEELHSVSNPAEERERFQSYATATLNNIRTIGENSPNAPFIV